MIKEDPTDSEKIEPAANAANILHLEIILTKLHARKKVVLLMQTSSMGGL